MVRIVFSSVCGLSCFLVFASVVQAQYVVGPYQYRTRGYSERRVTVHKQGDDPYAFRRNRSGVNMELWNQARDANPAQTRNRGNESAEGPDAHDKWDVYLQGREQELKERERRLRNSEQKIRSDSKGFERF